jgi:hypothetical protein
MCHTPGLSLASNVPDRTSLHHFSSLLVTCATVGGSIWWQGAVAPSGGRGGSSISWPQPHRQRGWWGGGHPWMGLHQLHREREKLQLGRATASCRHRCLCSARSDWNRGREHTDRGFFKKCTSQMGVPRGEFFVKYVRKVGS